MGRAIYDSSLPIEEACALYAELDAAQQQGISLTCPVELLFHLIQVSPCHKLPMSSHSKRQVVFI